MIENDSISNSDASTIIKLAIGLRIDKNQMLVAVKYLDNKKITEPHDMKDYI